MPEEQQPTNARRGPGRPPTGDVRTQISIRVHPTLLESVKLVAQQRNMPYQTLINDILAEEVSNIRGFDLTDENGKVGLLTYDLRQIAEKLRDACPNFESAATRIEELAETIHQEALAKIGDAPAPVRRRVKKATAKKAKAS